MNTIENIRFAHAYNPTLPVDFLTNPLFQVAGDGNLPQSFFTVLAKVKDTLMVYVTKGDIVIGRIEFNEAPAWLLKGTVMRLVCPNGSTVFHGNMLTGGTPVGVVEDIRQTFNDMVEFAQQNIQAFREPEAAI